jgi:hypothetical protein
MISPNLSVCPVTHVTSVGANPQALIDRQRALAAKQAGEDLVQAMALGDLKAARRSMQEMYAQIEARKAAREAGCYFCKQGDIDRLSMEAR